MLTIKNIVVFGGSKGIGKAIVDKLQDRNLYNVTDISRSSGYDLLSGDIPILKSKIDVFIYSAGMGCFFEKGRNSRNIRDIIQLGLEIPIILTNQIDADHYIYIGSNSSYYGFEGSETYCAVKHGILGFARALRKSGKKVSVVSPGAVDTAFWKDSGREKPELCQKPEDVANAVMCCIENDAVIEELLITPLNDAKRTARNW